MKSEAERSLQKLDNLTSIQGDLLGFPTFLSGSKFEAVVCMGDTLTHLGSLMEVKQLISEIYSALSENGYLILQFRDLTQPLEGSDRFIPVRSDERTVFTCFLEWDGEPIEKDGSGCTIKVHDLVHVKKGIGAWELCKSWYRKLGVTSNYMINVLQESGFSITDVTNDTGMITIVSNK